MASNPIRVGVLTGGGDCPGLNAVIRAVVRTSIGCYGWEIFGISDGFEGLLHDSAVRPLGDNEHGLLVRGGTILGTTNRGNPFEYMEEVDGALVERDYSDTVVERYHKLGFNALIVIGGDGSLKIADRFWHEKGLNVVGIPKTIDNDLKATDMTFGYQTAIVTATDAIDKLKTTAESHHRVMVLETMGRYVGWIALESGIGGGAHAILIPEIPYDIEVVARHITERSDSGRHFSIVVVSEGAYPAGGEPIHLAAQKLEKGAPRLGGIGDQVAHALGDLTGFETRCMVLGHLQRGGIPCAFDRVLSTRFGVAAVELVAAEQWGRMVCLRGESIESRPIIEAVSEFKAVEPDSQIVRTAERLGVSLGR
jgi:ATP-dependent phosphofructokinase / diphosphate-dependent phosphofructokinase